MDHVRMQRIDRRLGAIIHGQDGHLAPHLGPGLTQVGHDPGRTAINKVVNNNSYICHADVVHSGVAWALQNAWPFQVIKIEKEMAGARQQPMVLNRPLTSSGVYRASLAKGKKSL